LEVEGGHVPQCRIDGNAALSIRIVVIKYNKMNKLISVKARVSFGALLNTYTLNGCDFIYT